ncbi:MAG: helix-turn-helix domain-containing protein [Candidatus Methanomethylophilaceae archaeon]|nr:helix-turn-helix domain-containing protein [Candidatus Methanomethylophilaceae archaeon]
MAWRMYASGFTHKQIRQAFGVTDRTSRTWIARMREEGRSVPAGLELPKGGGNPLTPA